MKTALVLTGKTPNLGNTLMTIKKHVIDVCACDVFMFTTKEDMKSVLQYTEGCNISPEVMCFYEDRLEIPDTPWGRCIKEAGEKSAAPEHFGRKYHERHLLQIKGINNGLRYVFGNYDTYDWYIRCRFDMVFRNDLDDLSELDPENLYVPQYGKSPDSEWCYDRFGFGGYAVMHEYASRWEFVSNKCEVLPDKPVNCPERELAYFMTRAGIDIHHCQCKPYRYGMRT